MKISCAIISCSRRGDEAQTVAAVTWEARASSRRLLRLRGFTLIEIALCLAIIGFALLAIMVVLPYGLGAQRDNREETVIGQDAAVLLELIRSGSRGADDLTNYVYAITNYWTFRSFQPAITTSGVNGYTLTSYTVSAPYSPGAPLTNGANIIGLLSTPQFTDSNGNPIRKLDPSFVVAGYSNHIVAYVRSLSGIAAEKPPQNNDIMREDSFSYRIYAENAAQDFDVPAAWQPQNYNLGDLVVGDLAIYRFFGRTTYWRAISSGGLPTPSDNPTNSPRWQEYAYYNHLVAGARRELRLTFRWPVLPTGSTPKGPQTFRASVGQPDVTRTNSVVGQLLYFYQPQTVSAAP